MPSQQRLATWGRKLARERRPRIGIAWSGSRGNKNDRARSLRLEALAPILQHEAALHFLQPDLRQEDVATLARLGNVTYHGPALGDFADTAALIMQLDLVISVDTSVAHLAGALGKPVWILIPFSPAFRWLMHRTDSPWYPTARLSRQPEQGDWDGALRRLLAEVAEFMARSAARTPAAVAG